MKRFSPDTTRHLLPYTGMLLRIMRCCCV